MPICLPPSPNFNGSVEKGVVAGWGSIRDPFCTTNGQSPDKFHRCKFPFKFNNEDVDEDMIFDSCTFAPPPGHKNPVCKNFYNGLEHRKPFPRFPVEIHVDKELPVVCYNNTHGIYGWCGTMSQAEMIETPENTTGFGRSLTHAANNHWVSERVMAVGGRKISASTGWGWCQAHCQLEVEDQEDNKENKLKAKPQMDHRLGDRDTIPQSNLNEAELNVSKTTIPVGTYFGPYRGAKLNPENYIQAKESGYAWELLDSSQKKRVIGYIDPGPDPDPETNWLAIVNSANCKSHQNVVAVQYRGEIYYRVCSPIVPDKELLTYYGDNYSHAMGIAPKKFNEELGYKEQLSQEELKRIPCCQFCKVGFASREVFEKHNCRKRKEWTTTDGDVCFVCSECDAKFLTDQELQQHFENGSHINPKSFKCDKCEKRFRHAQSLYKHVKEAHENIRYHCPECGKVFGQSGNLDKHVKTVHKNERQFICAECGKTFGQSGHLKRHNRVVHLKILNYECSICKKRFGHGFDLKKHLRNVHKFEE